MFSFGRFTATPDILLVYKFRQVQLIYVNFPHLIKYKNICFHELQVVVCMNYLFRSVKL